MVTNIFNVGRSGLSDWLIQRISSIILTVYILTLLIFLIAHPALEYPQWHAFLTQTWMRLLSVLFLLSLLAHSWVGIWTILSDYVKSASLRLIIQIAVIILLFLCLVWGIQIFWGI